jgi:predicted nucleotidyltransferase
MIAREKKSRAGGRRISPRPGRGKMSGERRFAVLSEEIRTEIRPRLEAAFQDRFRGVLLFGSEARNQAGDDSDVDLMVLLKGPVRLGRDLETIVDALYPLQLRVDRPIHALPVSSEAFKEGRYGIYRSAQREGSYL